MHGKIQHLAMYTRIITFGTGISMEELGIRGFHVYQDNTSGERLVKMTLITVTQDIVMPSGRSL